MASSSAQVNNPAKTEHLGFTVGKLTKVNAVISLEVDPCFSFTALFVFLPQDIRQALVPLGLGGKKNLKI